MKNLLFPSVILSLLISFSSCKSKNADNQKISASPDHYLDSVNKADSLAKFGTPLDLNFSQASDTTNNNKRVSIIGYIAMPQTSYASGSTGQLSFIERPNESEGEFILSITIGDAKNDMKALPDKYTKEDVIITGKNGEKIGVGDRVKITGKLDVNSSYSSLDLQEIEKLDNVTIDYSTLNAAKISGSKPDASLEGKLVSAEGTLEMPTLTMSGESTFLYLHVPGIADQLTVDLNYGTEPGKIEPLPDNYTDKDIKIHDSKGNPVNMKKKVRVYGIWKNERLSLESIDNI